MPRREPASENWRYVAAFILVISGCGGSVVATTNGDGDGGFTATPPSCKGLAKGCGPTRDDDCCNSPTVTGGTFYRSYDGVDNNDKGFPATVSTFRLDKYEATVGRFRKFVGAFAQDMIPASAGANPNNPNDLGWDVAWNSTLPADATALADSVKRSPNLSTWTDVPGANEELPVNCVSWYEAFAFCIWDGGRLPTEAEWNYAAAGGAEQRMYPWGSEAPDCTHATFRALSADPDASVSCGSGTTAEVGSHSPRGDSRWDQSDVAGNVWEWVLDWYAHPYQQECDDCSQTTPGDRRVVRGGGFNVAATFYLTSSYRSLELPAQHLADKGIRCARRY